LAFFTRIHAPLLRATHIEKGRSNLKVSAYLVAIMLFAVALQGPPAQSQEVKAGDLVISQPWSRAAPKGAEMASSYLTVENKGASADRLLGGSAAAAEKLDVQQISMVGGGLTAHPVEGGLAIGPGDKVVLAPGGYYLALQNLKTPLKKGSKVSITLQFEKAGKIDVAFDVLSPSSKGPVAPKAASDDGKMKK
jgi:periplasmic copper chaperone A